MWNELNAYCSNHSSELEDILHQLERETHLKTLAPQMLSGHLQGAFLQLFSRLKQPKTIVEIGTFTGYSAICLAQGLAPDGILHTIDVNPEYKYLADKYFERAGVAHQINAHIGAAQDILPTIEGEYDLVFIDATKVDYADFYDLVIDKVVKGGYIIADNTLWYGKVLDTNKNNDTSTVAIDQYNKKVLQDPRVKNLLLPIRDGLMIAEKL